MAVLKCKMCGGDLVIAQESTARCEYCGCVQTVPKADDEKKLNLFARANRLRTACEFDKAALVYESIVSEFPEEAEAYWGLVLCKYGIEYVDDPATGKKVPTCHRSGFDSVMKDDDFQQALENADEMARRVYRQEAVAIEELRREIVGVSVKEQPYDVFICYKETDSVGNRTVDSVLAQDVYDALTQRGYRVFFARISLEDKLGQKYEPYIFAALHSTKVMLVFGTDYEHFNAVWVKNEWSRYLKMMAKDKDKHLIPCYKGIGPYDMPEEFTKLQAQDMGKLGALQDLIRGIEKLLPRKEEPKPQPAVVQEHVVLEGNVESKLAALLERGDMALEDGDWARADSFYEEALNYDPKNGRGYVGKALARERCRNLQEMALKRQNAYIAGREERVYIPVDLLHREEMMEKYTVTGYLKKSDIGRQYDKKVEYRSMAGYRRRQYDKELEYWHNNKALFRAEQFAEGELATKLAACKQAVMNTLQERLTQAEAESADAKAAAQKVYDDYIVQIDARVLQLYEDARKRRESDYQTLMQRLRTETNPQVLLNTARLLEAIGDYKDCKELADQCIAKAEAGRELARQQVEKKKQAQQLYWKKRNKMVLIGWIAALALVTVANMALTSVGYFFLETGDIINVMLMPIVTLVTEILFGTLTVGVTAVALVLDPVKNKAAKFFSIAALVLSALGVIVWGTASMAMMVVLAVEGLAEVWAGLYVLGLLGVNLVCLVAPFLQKRK